MFCYTGGFSVYAMRGNATLVHSVDSSAKAIDLTNKNIELNFPGDNRHAAYAEDAFKYLDRMGDQYDLIILDPPAFAKHRDALRNALQGYRKLNVKAFEKSNREAYFHILLFAGRQQREFPHCRIHRRCHVRPQRAHPAPVDAARRPPGKHLSPRRRIPKGLVLYVE